MDPAITLPLWLSILMKLIIFSILLFSIIVHELAHAYIAYRCGDPTAKEMKRFTFNPLKHLDPIGTLALPLFMDAMRLGFIFGYAKPVKVCYYNFRSPKRDMALVAVAGPLSNILMAGMWAAALMMTRNGSSEFMSYLAHICFFGVIINEVLTIVNLLPIPPLDGSHLLFLPVPFHVQERYAKYIMPIGLILLLVLMRLNIIKTIIESLARLMGIGS